MTLKARQKEQQIQSGLLKNSKPNEPVIYYLHDGPKQGFVCEELLIVLVILDLLGVFNLAAPSICHNMRKAQTSAAHK